MHEEAFRFISDSVTDPRLAGELASVVGDRGLEQAADEAAALARSRGYAVDPENLTAARRELAAAAEAEAPPSDGAPRDAPLSDAELTGVSGGFAGAFVGGLARLHKKVNGAVTRESEDKGNLDPRSVRFWFPGL